jgi:copper chaperone CopZ
VFKDMKVVYIAGFVILTIFGAYYYKDILFTNTSEGEHVEAPKETVVRKFNVKGMYCESCKIKIEKAVNNIPGVVHVVVDQETNEMKVTYDAMNESIQKTLTTVNSMGYTTGLKSSSGKLQVLDFNVTFQ